MNCSEARSVWMLYVDSEGDPALHLRVTEHLSGCTACAAWFAAQGEMEDGIRACMAAEASDGAMWNRVLAKAGVLPQPGFRPLSLLVIGTTALAAVVLLVLFVGWHWTSWFAEPPTVAQDAADMHRRWLRGDVPLDFASTSELAVDRYFKANAPFKVHCPPRSNVKFTVQGAAILRITDDLKAGFIVGRVDATPVSILVLDRAALSAFPRDKARLSEGAHLHGHDGDLKTAAKIVGDNIVVVVGRSSPKTLETLLDAYGSYH